MRPKGLSFLTAALWSVGATALFQLVLLLALALNPRGELDIVAGVACQAIAYLLALFLFLRRYEPDTSLDEVIAYRRADLSLVGLSMALGVALQFPVSAIGGLVEQLFPRSEAEWLARAQHLEALTPPRMVAVVMAVVVIGPLVEELFFRGALYRGLRRAHTAGMTTLGVAAFFAAAHQDGRVFLPILVVGLAMTHLRALSGSLLPPLALHMAFNATSILPTLGKRITVEEMTTAVPPLPLLLGTLASAALWFACLKLATSSPRALAARSLDAELASDRDGPQREDE